MKGDDIMDITKKGIQEYRENNGKYPEEIVVNSNTKKILMKCFKSRARVGFDKYDASPFKTTLRILGVKIITMDEYEPEDERMLSLEIKEVDEE